MVWEIRRKKFKIEKKVSDNNQILKKKTKETAK
jgi:hypothetical protein